MTTIEQLRLEMEAAARALDFDLAARLRDQISILRGQSSTAESSPVDADGLTRQQPGKMGLGTSQQRYPRPAGWTPPPKPDPMTRGRGRKAKTTP
jgi:hypothetical protein